MGFIPFVRGVAQGVNNFTNALEAPEKARTALQRTEQAAAQRRQQQADADAGLQQQVATGRVNNQIGFEALPVNMATAEAANQIVNANADRQAERSNESLVVQGDVAQGVVGAASDGTVKVTGAKAAGDVTRQQGWADNIYPRQKEILELTQNHDSEVIGRFLGDEAALPQVLAANAARDDKLLEHEMAMRGDKWLQTASQLAGAAGLILL